MKKLMLLVLGILIVSLVGVGVLAEEVTITNTLEKDTYTFRSIELDEDTLTLDISSSGGCQNHSFDLTWAGGFFESLPVQVDLHLYHDANNDSCEALLMKTLQFDLTPIKESYEETYLDSETNKITLNFYDFEDNKHELTYSWEAQVVCSSDNLDLCLDETNCTDADGFWYDDICNEEEEEPEDNETGNGRQGLGQIIRGRVKAGVYTSPTGEQIRVRELAQNRFLLQVNNVSADCECELEEETENNKTKLKAKLSNGRNAEIKILPDVAAEKALERLRLKVCSAENNCSIELKEVGKGEQTQLAYELQAERHAKLLGMFRAKMKVKAQVDAETGEIIRVKKPWWAFLASEGEE